MLKIENLYMKYNKTPVVKGISLTVAPGEIHGLIGENSAGKTTLIKCAVGIYMPDEGTITYDDLPIYDNPVAKCKVGYVADSCPYIEGYSIKKTVKMYECFYDKFDKERFNHFNAVFQLPVNKSISSLSKGQKMKLTFMLEVAKNPEYLVLDEPTSGLDPVAKKQFFDFLIQEVEERNIGVLISSHNLASLESLCDSITMVHEGQVERQLSMEEMKSELTRLNVVIEGGAPKAVYEMPEIMKISNVGSIYTIVVKDYNESIAEKLCKNGASFMEAMDVSLEELFVILEENREKNVDKNQYMA
ncbi:MAG: ABC transporter ATP-binding protein [Eubacteriales bacterium]|nr:ABC transporter ATP-binding protein [Eubacteriales bacterium]